MLPEVQKLAENLTQSVIGVVPMIERVNKQNDDIVIYARNALGFMYFIFGYRAGMYGTKGDQRFVSAGWYYITSEVNFEPLNTLQQTEAIQLAALI
jgi:hypothetical protein